MMNTHGHPVDIVARWVARFAIVTATITLTVSGLMSIGTIGPCGLSGFELAVLLIAIGGGLIFAGIGAAVASFTTSSPRFWRGWQIALALSAGVFFVLGFTAFLTPGTAPMSCAL
jgi:hypothetical protein